MRSFKKPRRALEECGSNEAFKPWRDIERKRWLRAMDPEALRAISVGLPQSESAQGAERHQGAERLQNAERHKSARSPYWQYAREVVEMPREHRVTRGSNIYKPVKAIEAEVK